MKVSKPASEALIDDIKDDIDAVAAFTLTI
jgi:hypothetical protein